MAFRKEVFNDYQFDERFEWGHEETEFAEHIVQDFDIHYAPEMLVEHQFADSYEHYLKKMYMFGKSDVIWWKKTDGKITTTHLKWSIPWPWVVANLILTSEYKTQTVGALSQRFGRLHQLFTELLSL